MDTYPLNVTWKASLHLRTQSTSSSQLYMIHKNLGVSITFLLYDCKIFTAISSWYITIQYYTKLEWWVQSLGFDRPETKWHDFQTQSSALHL